MPWHPIECGFLEIVQAALHHNDIIRHRQLENLKAIFHLPHDKLPVTVKDFFPSPLFIILISYARGGSLTLLNMCQTLFMTVKLFKRPIYKRRKSFSALTHIYILARKGTQSWVLGQVWLVVGSVWALICNSRPNPRVHLSETRGGQAAISISPVSLRGREEQDGDISTTLQCIKKKGWYRISSKLTMSSLLCNMGGKNTSKVVVEGEDSMYFHRFTTSPDLCIYLESMVFTLTLHIRYKVAQVIQDVHQCLLILHVHLLYIFTLN